MSSSTHQLTYENLSRHGAGDTSQKDAQEKERMKTFAKEHDQYRHFLVTGETEKRRQKRSQEMCSEKDAAGRNLNRLFTILAD
ncbi:MAG: hypothetical protein ASARMPREDX12_004434 [Alectoria sarmentosa]|nr:MAG: hypothetical protein ASARMPREDX12_004434 [Alectoria sarmentosa]